MWLTPHKELAVQSLMIKLSHKPFSDWDCNAQAGNAGEVGGKGANGVEGSQSSIASPFREDHKMDLRFLRERCFHTHTTCFVTGEEPEKRGNVSMQ